MTGKFWIGSAIFLVLFLTTGAGLAAEKLRFATHVKTHPLYVLPILAAQEKGFFKEQGLEVEYFPFSSGPVLHRAIAAGSLDIATSGLLSLSQVVARGAPARGVTDTGTLEEWFLWVPAGSLLKAPMDLKGTKISVTSLGSLTHALALAVPRALGIEKEVKIVAAGGTPARVAALKSGATPVTVSPFFTMAPLVVKGEIREFLNVGDYVPRAVFTQLLVAHENLAKSKPGVVRAGIRAYMEGARFIMENRPWTLQKMMTHPDLNLPKDVAEAAYPKLHYGPAEKKVSRADIRAVLNWLVENGLMRPGEVPTVERVSPEEFSE